MKEYIEWWGPWEQSGDVHEFAMMTGWQRDCETQHADGTITIRWVRDITYIDE